MQFSSALLENAVNEFSRLPGIGKKTALRLVLHLLKMEAPVVQGFGERFERVLRYRAVLFRAENEAHWRILAWERSVLASIIQVQVHLTCIGMRELAELQIDDNQASKSPMEEQQIYSIPRVSDTQAALPANEGEVVAEF